MGPVLDGSGPKLRLEQPLFTWDQFGQEQIWNGSKTEPAFLQVQFWNHFV